MCRVVSDLVWPYGHNTGNTFRQPPEELEGCVLCEHFEDHVGVAVGDRFRKRDELMELLDSRR